MARSDTYPQYHNRRGDGEGVSAHVSFVARNLQRGIVSRKGRRAPSGSRPAHLPERDFRLARVHFHHKEASDTNGSV